jgi:hypothetical protein
MKCFLCEYNIKLDHKEIVCEVMGQVHVAHGRDAANMAINFSTNIMFLDIIHRHKLLDLINKVSAYIGLKDGEYQDQLCACQLLNKGCDSLGQYPVYMQCP